MHDPFAMRPFFGYNFGDYLQHWLSFADEPKNKLPKVFHVNWFRKDKNGKFLWPGFGENCRVLDWIVKRVRDENVAQRTPVGLVPKPGSLDLSVSLVFSDSEAVVVCVVGGGGAERGCKELRRWTDWGFEAWRWRGVGEL